MKRDLPRLRVAYAKGERLAYLGHLEVLTTMERALRRSGLPVSIGNGFARRMRVQFSQALPVGASSACEYLDARLEERVDAQEALDRLVRATPAGLAPTRAAYVRGDLPALEAWLDRASWELQLARVCSADELAGAIRELGERGELRYLRGDREKVVDLARTLVGFEVREDEGVLTLALDTRSGSGGSLRPQVLLDAALSLLGVSAADAPHVRRTRQAHEEHGRLVEPFDVSEQVADIPLS